MNYRAGVRNPILDVAGPASRVEPTDGSTGVDHLGPIVEQDLLVAGVRRGGAVCGYVLLYDQMVRFASAQPDEWATARAILEDAVAYWQERSIPFYVLMRGTWWHGRNFPNL